MRIFSFLILLVFVPLSLSAQMMNVRQDTSKGEYVLWVKNRLPCPFQLYAKAPGMDTKFEESLPGKGESMLIKLPLDTLKKYPDFKDTIEFNVTVGSPFAVHDSSYRYMLPFPQGKFYRLTQGNQGNFTHNKLSTRYSFDFEMPEGSTVTAARGGLVVYVVERFSQGGIDESFRDKGNHIMVCHDDGTIAIYGHLKKNGALVEVGDLIFAGQPIGLSGNTGFSTTPHLHFGVQVADSSIAIRFRDLPETLQPHRYYEQNLNFSENAEVTFQKE
jgi:murein DD-endopeptidase MepM/ murein hydrolase activator NlpD